MKINRKKLLPAIGFLIVMIIASIVIFYDPVPEVPKPENEKSDSISTDNNVSEQQDVETTTPTYDEGLSDAQLKSQELDLKNKSGWYWTGMVNGKEVYEELWLYGEHWEYSYDLWENGEETRMVNGHYALYGDNKENIVYWIDDKELTGEFIGDTLKIGDKVYKKMSND